MLWYRELTPIGFQVQNLASENINLSSSRREKPFSLDATQEDSSQVKNSLIEFHGKNPGTNIEPQVMKGGNVP